MSISRLRDRQEIERFLERDPWLNIYALGDLDDFFFPHTTWYGSRSRGELDAIVLLYAGPGVPTLLALGREPEPLAALVAGTQRHFPDRFYAHLSPGIESTFGVGFAIESGGPHRKMALRGAPSGGIDIASAQRLGPASLSELQALYDESYPGNWFDPRMLETGEYFGIREEGRLVSVAGIHVYSPRYRVAALGNIVTRPERRGRGYGTQVTAALCRSLADKEIRIGLNVRADNEPAIASYRRIGFTIAAPYNEYMLRRR